jgi:uncharacterized protein (TIGR02421 family)
MAVPKRRAEALIAHEVETHILTYANGRQQPFHLLYCGMGDYDALQEGLAVFAEYLVGGLTGARLRVLAARVDAARRLIRGADFLQTFRALQETWGFEPRTAYTISMRVYRGGGLVKDAIYLRGLVELLDYLKADGQLEPLFAGKISAEDVGLVRELQERRVLEPTPCMPTFLGRPEVKKRLAFARGARSVLDLLGPGSRP